MLIAGIASMVVGVLNLALYLKLQSMVRAGRLPGIVAVDPADYRAAKDRVRAASPWSSEGKSLRTAIRETDKPGTARKNAMFWAALSVGFIVVGIGLVVAGLAA
jgi:hypothetical protein